MASHSVQMGQTNLGVIVLIAYIHMARKTLCVMDSTIVMILVTRIVYLFFSWQHHVGLSLYVL
ncbi:hypothetical protein E2C01_078263 [Portunus trituberculatus]|uniref:Uncharacterized protein n=1 Tax=Portunus trituberculatus TaxID=210409 RepID=A0A5B7IDJ4_PORTR|nr:hypothetical protein [Portunus trituberculatus]